MADSEGGVWEQRYRPTAPATTGVEGEVLDIDEVWRRIKEGTFEEVQALIPSPPHAHYRTSTTTTPTITSYTSPAAPTTTSATPTPTSFITTVDNVNTLRDEDGSSALHWAAYMDRVDVVELLLDHGADIDCVNEKERQTPLHWACIGKSTRCLALLVHKGADVSVGDRRGYTALLHCAQYDHTLGAAYLVHTGGARTTETDSEGHTALHWAAYMRHEATARLLCALGSDVTARDTEGLTPLHWSALKGNHPLARLLLRYGADPLLSDNDGYTPEDLARSKQFHNTVSLLHAAAQPLPSNPYLAALVSTPTRRWHLAHVLPYIVLPGVFIILHMFPLWVSLPLLALLGYKPYTFLARYWLPRDVNNPFFVSVLNASVGFSAWHYFTTILPLTADYVGTTCVFLVLCMVWMLFFRHLVRSDPGFIKPAPHALQTFLNQYLGGSDSEHEFGDLDSIPPLCTTCLDGRPLRSKHCRSCDGCVARMDHHCTWINNCVGANNHLAFLMLLVLIILMHAMFLFLCYIVVSTHGDASAWGIGRWWGVSRVTVVLMTYHLANMCWECFVLYQQVCLILNNLTANEYHNAPRYWYFRDAQNEVVNPFNKGYQENLQEFLHKRDSYHTLFTLPV
eukprot:TRINITY_DN3081_c0_g1_i1.p1 TRINITY_DN3081_c0_g1~~TRINITY_DN3081_c0_g1_i1.p1  ORF type:complete len:624 (-),score=82.58 TRINITY_DN3081_c0_g1_i1:16-1887(-)